MTDKIRVVLADDHVLVRSGLRLLLQGTGTVDVVGEADDGRAAMVLVKMHHPQVILMDISMPGLNGLDATVQIKREFPDVHVIILSMYTSEDYVLQAMRAGASGYLIKDSAPQEIELALKAVMRGDTFLSPRVSHHVIESYVGRLQPGGEVTSPVTLTSRQREILQLLAEGHNTKEIAYRLNVSTKTVEAHRAQIMDKLDIHDVPGLVRYAIRIGLITASE